MRVTCPECGQDQRLRREAKYAADRCPVCQGLLPSEEPSAPAPTPNTEAGQPAAVDLKRTCPSCGTKFPAQYERCPECGTDYRMARGLDDAPSKLELSPTHPLRGGWVGFLFLYIPYLGVSRIVAAVKGLTKPRYDKDRRTRRRVTERRGRSRRR